MNIDKLIEKHNNLCDEIMSYITNGVEPPRALCLEYINNFELEREHIERGDISMVICGCRV